MEFVSILGTKPQKEAPHGGPVFFLDLNLDQIIRQVQYGMPQYEILRLFYTFPENAQEEAYRRGIYQDVKKEEVGQSLERFLDTMQRYGKAMAGSQKSSVDFQRKIRHLEAAYLFTRALSELQKDLDGFAKQNLITSDGMLALKQRLDREVLSESFQQRLTDAADTWQKVREFRFVLSLEGNKLTIFEGQQEAFYDQELQKLFASFYPEGREDLSSPFSTSQSLSSLEIDLLTACFKKYPALRKSIYDFVSKYPSWEDELYLTMEKELPYYIAFCRFQRKYEGYGFTFTTPLRDQEKIMEAAGVYDLALAITNHIQGKPVIDNRFRYEKGERFFVVNGPNQGGKTTFARSLGQLIYFTKMGLDVPAEFANIHYFTNLLTHFSVEESMETGQGKLMEELNRLAPMMDGSQQDAFVIINELFTTAAHYDGCVMGARVLDYFREQNCMGIYVTHLRELGDTVEGVVGMAAMLEENGSHKRTYHIQRSRAELMGYAEDIVAKYHLTYDQLRERLQIPAQIRSEASEEKGETSC